LRFIVDLFHVLYCSGSMCVGVTVWLGCGILMHAEELLGRTETSALIIILQYVIFQHTLIFQRA